MCEEDIYHVSEFCEWFYRGVHETLMELLSRSRRGRREAK
jgi:hypothetical protein